MIELKQHRKSQTHSAYNQTWSVKGDSDFTAFSNTTALAGDVWRCSADEQVVNEVSGNITVYKGDLIIAMEDNPGELTWTNLNAGKWDIMRKNPIGSGTKQTGVDGGVLGEKSFDDDYEYLCVEAGEPETLSGSGDGTATWKKKPLLAT
jgi:hypothetical protein